MEIKISLLEQTVNEYPELKRGCIVDTNVLFAGYKVPTPNSFSDAFEKVVGH